MIRLIIVLISFLSLPTLAQRTVFTSAVDKDLTIKALTVAPIVDNVSEIYSKPLTDHLKSLVANDRHWKSVDLPAETKIEAKASPEDFEEKPDVVKAVLKKAKVDALISTRISKGPKGLTIKMNLFSGKDGLLLAQQILTDYTGFETSDLKIQIANIYESLKRKMPYDGTVLSRRGLLVTIDLGSNQGLREDQDLTAIQILKVSRHPKFRFLVSTEKEIIGKIKVKKVEENLSFGTIVTERDEASLQPGQKFIVENFVRYPDTPLSNDGKVLTELGQRKDTPVAFGDKASEWIPETTPTYGKLGVLFGLGTYQVSNNLSGAGGISGSSSLTPSIQVDGEMWLNPNWFAEVTLRQFILSLNNPYPGSSPGKLNVSTTQYTLLGGYNFLVADQFFGPKLQLMGGYSKMTSFIDQSTPIAFTTVGYSGLVFGLGGSVPLALESKTPITLGARLNFFWNPTLDESPVTSGNASSKVTSFNGYLEYRYSQRMILKGMLAYDLFSSTLTGTGGRGEAASSISHSMMTLAAGAEYMF